MTEGAIDLAALDPGFGDPVHDSQRAFRAILDALSRPGLLARIEAPLSPPPGLGRAAAAAVLALADSDTPLWLEGPAAEASDWFRFHCGCPLAGGPQDAVFAVVPGERLRLADFAAGSPEFPERSATVIATVGSLQPLGPWRLSGPGVRREVPIGIEGLPDGFLDDWERNAALYPCGVDLILAAGHLALGLPRSVRIEA